MTLRTISRKLIKNNFKQYGLLFFSILFSISMTGAYSVLQYSSTITDVLVDGGSTQTISSAMFYCSMIGINIFLIYADSLFLKYKSKEIGVFLSLGLNYKAVKSILNKEFTFIYQVATAIGLIISIPLAFLCWSILNLFLRTEETSFKIGWLGMAITVIFSIIAWLILKFNNSHYLKRLDIIKILKYSSVVESTKNGKLHLLSLGIISVPLGIILFFTFQEKSGYQNIASIFFTVISNIGLILLFVGVYITIIQLASIGDIFKKFKKITYYQNIVFFNLLKQKIHQYTRSIFVSTLLIAITIFGLGFISVGFIDGYFTALNSPYDYIVNSTFREPNITKEKINKIADATNTEITTLKELPGLLVGMKNTYRDLTTDWSSRIIVSQTTFNTLTNLRLDVPNGTYTLYYDKKMVYKLNAFYSQETTFYNPTQKSEFTLKQNPPIEGDSLFNIHTFFSSFIVLNDKDYKSINESLSKEYRFTSYMLNIPNWKNSLEFHDIIVKKIVSENNGEILVNWSSSAIFDKQNSTEKYISYQNHKTQLARIWQLYPFSKLSNTKTQYETFATYLMLILFIAIIAFVSSIMVIGLKILSTIWDDSITYKSLMKLGETDKNVFKLIRQQMLFVYFIPTILGSIIGAFATYRIMLVSSVTYISQVMNLVGILCLLTLIIQILLFFILYLKVIRNYTLQ